MIRWQRMTATSGIPASMRTCSAASTRRPERSKNSIRPPKVRVRTGWSKTKTARSGSRPIPKATSASSIPKNGEFFEYKLAADARDPHTPLFDHKGILWFTVQNSNKVGRLNPATGDIKIVDSPTKPSNPYGMVVDTKGTPYYCEFGAPKIAAINPDTMAIHEWTLPHPESRPRRIAITSDDIIYYADYSRGYLGRLDPKTGAIKEWPSPGGPKSQPYGITFLNGAIWYSESAVKPNTLARFDPKTEKFQTWAIPQAAA